MPNPTLRQESAAEARVPEIRTDIVKECKAHGNTVGQDVELTLFAWLGWLGSSNEGSRCKQAAKPAKASVSTDAHGRKRAHERLS